MDVLNRVIFESPYPEIRFLVPDVTVTYKFKNIELRNFGNTEVMLPRRLEPCAEFSFGELILNLDEKVILEDLHKQAEGSLKAFFYKDPANYYTTADSEVITEGVHTEGFLVPIDSDRKAFQAVKAYCVGDICGYKTIHSFVPQTVGLKRFNTSISPLDTPYTIDLTSGTVTFSESQPNGTIYLDCQFYTVVRFESDRLDFTLFSKGERDWFRVSNLKIVEVLQKSVKAYSDKDFLAPSCDDYSFDLGFLPETTIGSGFSTKIESSEILEERRTGWAIQNVFQNLGASVIYGVEMKYIQAYFFSKKGSLLPFYQTQGSDSIDNSNRKLRRFDTDDLTFSLVTRDEDETTWEFTGVDLVEFTRPQDPLSSPVINLSYKIGSDAWESYRGEDLTYTVNLISTQTIPGRCKKAYQYYVHLGLLPGYKKGKTPSIWVSGGSGNGFPGPVPENAIASENPIFVNYNTGSSYPIDATFLSRDGASSSVVRINMPGNITYVPPTQFRVSVTRTLTDSGVRYQAYRGDSPDDDPTVPLGEPIDLDDPNSSFVSVANRILLNGTLREVATVSYKGENFDLMVPTPELSNKHYLWVEPEPYQNEFTDDCEKIDTYELKIFDKGVEKVTRTIVNQVPIVIRSTGKGCIQYLSPPAPGICKKKTGNLIGFNLKTETIKTFDYDLTPYLTRSGSRDLFRVRSVFLNTYSTVTTERFATPMTEALLTRWKLNLIAYPHMWRFETPMTDEIVYGYGRSDEFFVNTTSFRYLQATDTNLVEETKDIVVGLTGVFNRGAFVRYLRTEVSFDSGSSWEEVPEPTETIYTLDLVNDKTALEHQVSINFNPDPKNCPKSSIAPLTYCVRIIDRNGVTKGFTSHQTDLIVAGVTYKALSAIEPTALSSKINLSTDNLDLKAFLDDDGIRPEDLRGGLYDNARITIALVNFLNIQTPFEDNTVLLDGYAGDISATDTYYKMELRSKSSILNQNVSKKTSILCPHNFGDSKCRYNLQANGLLRTSAIAAKINSKRFSIGGSPLNPSFVGGHVDWLSGENKGFTYEIAGVSGTEIVLANNPQFPIAVGDEIRVVGGCKKTVDACKAYSNYINFGGFPADGNFMPGPDKILGGDYDRD